MSRSLFAAARLALGLATAVTLALVGSQPAAASGATTSGATAAGASWQLVDLGQRVCIPADQSWFTYFLVAVEGQWSAPLEIGARNLPAGTTTSLPHAPVPPGTGDGHTVVNMVAMTLPPLPFGVYQPELTASDGAHTQSVPVTIRVQERRGC
ncbi:DUF5980 family protein [Micromonospora sp. WMMD882]|uniref:DUF5980 family protein n=1 Tax=Micromonospora sp. WMMD882 TaxID=3015151 RepID=UPI00248B3E17|nr:DUF5980 family protein [Micromonospora sp. WMMD882]WBB80182.1 DUF5980 family protein [Micromonospora sp. WMMD882]